MPLNIDWAQDTREPLAFLSQWSLAVAAALKAQLTGSAGRFVVESVHSTRVQATEAVAALTAPTEPAPTLVTTARFTDRVGVNVIDTVGERTVVAAVLFATPDNKVDSDASLAFAVRAAGFMSSGAGVVIVDAVPGPASWATHLHSLTGVYPITRRPRNNDAPVLAVCPSVQDGAGQFAVWHHSVAPGAPLPTVTLAVRGAMPLKLALEATYAEALLC